MKEFKLLVADKNPYIREFLKRELMADGYQIHVAENGQQVLNWAFHHEPLDLLILDPDLPDTDESSLLKKIHSQLPDLPVVIHTFLSDYAGNPKDLNAAAYVEKGESSIEILKNVLHDILKKDITPS